MVVLGVVISGVVGTTVTNHVQNDRAFRRRFTADSVAAVPRTLMFEASSVTHAPRGSITYRCTADSLGAISTGRTLEYQIFVMEVDTLPLVRLAATPRDLLPEASRDGGETDALRRIEEQNRRFYEESRQLVLANTEGMRVDLKDTAGFTVQSFSVSQLDLIRVRIPGQTMLGVQGSRRSCPAASVERAGLLWAVWD